MLQICENIRQTRVSKGISQEDMAEQIGVSRSTYKNWESTTEPELATIRRIAEIFETPAVNLLMGVFEFDATEISRADEIQKRKEIDEIKASLNKLTLAIGRLSGIDKEEIRASFPAYSLGKKAVDVFENLRKKRDNDSKRDN